MNNQLTIIGRVGQDPRAVSFAGHAKLVISIGISSFEPVIFDAFWHDFFGAIWHA